MIKRLALLCWVGMTVGCSTDVRNFNLYARNDTQSNITLNLAKDVQQREELWASPEDIDDGRVMVTPFSDLGIVMVPPGRIGWRNGISGHFPNGAQAVLRVYRGKDLSMKELLAMKPGEDRQDVLLKPGDNKFVVRDRDGKLSIDRLP